MTLSGQPPVDECNRDFSQTGKGLPFFRTAWKNMHSADKEQIGEQLSTVTVMS